MLINVNVEVPDGIDECRYCRQRYPGHLDILRKGFNECWRVLKPDGTMVFKWSEVQIRLSEIRDLFPSEPICGNRVPKNSGTHWLVFFKPTEGEE